MNKVAFGQVFLWSNPQKMPDIYSGMGFDQKEITIFATFLKIMGLTWI